MKVAKVTKPVNAAVDNTDNATEELNASIVDDAVGYIRSAIDRLGALARRTNEPKYKEAIANLSVVLFDLQD